MLAGTSARREYHLEAVDRPQIMATVARVTPPAYTNVPAYTLGQQTAFELVRGAGLQLDVTLNKPVEEAYLVRDGGERYPVEFLASDVLRAEWTTPESGTYAFELIDENGFDDLRPVRFGIQVVPDAAPVVRLSIPDAGKTITPTARLRLVPRCEDVYGLASAAARVSVDKQAPLELLFADFTPGQKLFETELVVDVSGWAVVPGQRLPHRRRGERF